MRASLRRALVLLIATVAVGLAAATATTSSALADPQCPAGTNWDGRLMVCR